MRPGPVGSVGVVGAGAVGQAVATTLVASGICERLLVVSRTPDRAVALVADLDDMRQSTASPVQPEARRVADLIGCHAVVVAARASFTNTRATDVRMGGAVANGPVIRTLGTALLFPRIDPAAVPALVDGERTLGESDFMSGATEDRYPDHFGLAHGIDGGGSDLARATVAEHLAALPHHQVVLGHDVTANADFLAKLADHL